MSSSAGRSPSRSFWGRCRWSGAVPCRICVAHLSRNGSYSIYLWHTLAISVVAKVAQSLALSPLAAVTLSTAAGVLLGAAAYEIVEKPLRGLLQKPVITPARERRVMG